MTQRQRSRRFGGVDEGKVGDDSDIVGRAGRVVVSRDLRCLCFCP